MKKIKEYINTHPKLKRLAKILAIVAILLSFLFNALIIGSLIINATQHKEDNTTQVLAYGDYKPTTKHYIDDRYAVYYGLGDFLSETYAQYQYLALSTGEGLSDPNNIGGTGLGIDDFNAGTLINIAQPSYTFTYEMNSNGNSLNVRNDITNVSVSIQKDSSVSFASYNIIYTYRYVNGSSLYRYYFNYSRYYIAETDYMNWSTCYVMQTSSNNGSSWSSIASGLNGCNIYFLFTKNEYFNWLYNTHNYYNTAYNTGYDNGQQNGYSRGYDEGYDNGHGVGYYEGLEAGQQGESTMFTLISQAFNSVASILDIQILPNLSLGLLIFTPLIVTIIIVVVKMVKG